MLDANGQRLRDGSRIGYVHACVGIIERGGAGTRMSIINGWPVVRCLCGDTVFLAPNQVWRVSPKRRTIAAGSGARH